MAKNKENKSVLSKIFIVIFFIGCFALGIGFGILQEKYEINDKGFLIGYLIFITMLFIAYILQVIIHEGGHLVFGLLSGYDFVSFRIGSITLVKEDNKYFFKRFSIAGTGGQCLMMPKAKEYKESKFILFNLGGVILNTIAILISMYLYTLNNNGYYKLFLVLFIIVGAFCIILNGIPFKVNGINNDGKNALRCYKDDIARYSFYTQLKINGLLYKGIRIREIDRNLYKLPEDADKSDSLVIGLRGFEADYYLDNLDFDNAKSCYENLLKDIPSNMKIYVYESKCELMFFEILKDNKEAVNNIYTKELQSYIKASKNSISKNRLMYAYYLLIEDDKNKAAKELKKFKKNVNSYPIKGSVLLEEDLVEYVIKCSITHSKIND